MSKFNTEKYGNWNSADSMADSIMTEVEKQQPNLTNEEYDKIYNEICDKLEELSDYDDSIEIYGVEVWTPEDNRQRECGLCGKMHCNCDALIDRVRGK